MRAKYDFSGGVVGKYIDRYRGGTSVVLLDPELNQVNRATRGARCLRLPQERFVQGGFVTGAALTVAFL
jgi:hypothetical protein